MSRRARIEAHVQVQLLGDATHAGDEKRVKLWLGVIGAITERSYPHFSEYHAGEHINCRLSCTSVPVHGALPSVPFTVVLGVQLLVKKPAIGVFLPNGVALIPRRLISRETCELYVPYTNESLWRGRVKVTWINVSIPPPVFAPAPAPSIITRALRGQLVGCTSALHSNALLRAARERLDALSGDLYVAAPVLSTAFTAYYMTVNALMLPPHAYLLAPAPVISDALLVRWLTTALGVYGWSVPAWCAWAVRARLLPEVDSDLDSDLDLDLDLDSDIDTDLFLGAPAPAPAPAPALAAVAAFRAVLVLPHAARYVDDLNLETGECIEQLGVSAKVPGEVTGDCDNLSRLALVVYRAYCDSPSQTPLLRAARALFALWVPCQIQGFTRTRRGTPLEHGHHFWGALWRADALAARIGAPGGRSPETDALAALSATGAATPEHVLLEATTLAPSCAEDDSGTLTAPWAWGSVWQRYVSVTSMATFPCRVGGLAVADISVRDATGCPASYQALVSGHPSMRWQVWGPLPPPVDIEALMWSRLEPPSAPLV